MLNIVPNQELRTVEINVFTYVVKALLDTHNTIQGCDNKRDSKDAVHGTLAMLMILDIALHHRTYLL